MRFCVKHDDIDLDLHEVARKDLNGGNKLQTKRIGKRAATQADRKRENGAVSPNHKSNKERPGPYNRVHGLSGYAS